jgi:hypothetical protein
MGGTSGYRGEEIMEEGSTRQVSFDYQVEESLYPKRMSPPAHQFAVNLTQMLYYTNLAASFSTTPMSLTQWLWF